MAQQIVKASFWARVGAALIDGLLAVAVAFPLAVVLFANGDTRLTSLSIIMTILGFAYGTLMEAGRSGATVGKMAAGIRVVKLETGARLSTGQSATRQGCKLLFNIIGLIPFIGWLVQLLNYLSMLWDPAKMTWHDKMSKTVVVPKSVYPPAA